MDGLYWSERHFLSGLLQKKIHCLAQEVKWIVVMLSKEKHLSFDSDGY